MSNQTENKNLEQDKSKQQELNKNLTQEKEKPKSEGVFSKMGHLITNAFEGAKELNFPNLKEHGKEEENERLQEKQEEKATKEEKREDKEITTEKTYEILGQGMEGLKIQGDIPMEEKIYFIMADTKDYTGSSSEKLKQEQKETKKEEKPRKQEEKPQKEGIDVRKLPLREEKEFKKLDMLQQEKNPKPEQKDLKKEEIPEKTQQPQQEDKNLDQDKSKHPPKAEGKEKSDNSATTKYIVKSVSGRDSEEYDNAQRSLPLPNLN